MVPPATALTHNKAICAEARHTAASSAQSAARARLTVAPQLPRAASSSVCRGLPLAFLQALDQKEPEDIIRLGGSFKEAMIRQWAQCCSVVAAAAVFEKRALVRCADGEGTCVACCAACAPSHRTEWNWISVVVIDNTTTTELWFYKRGSSAASAREAAPLLHCCCTPPI